MNLSLEINVHLDSRILEKGTNIYKVITLVVDITDNCLFGVGRQLSWLEHGIGDPGDSVPNPAPCSAFSCAI